MEWVVGSREKIKLWENVWVDNYEKSDSQGCLIYVILGNVIVELGIQVKKRMVWVGEGQEDKFMFILKGNHDGTTNGFREICYKQNLFRKWFTVLGLVKNCGKEYGFP